MAFRVRARWWEGTKIKHTDWSETKYVKTTVTGYWTDWSDWSTTRLIVTSNMQEKVCHHMQAAKCKNCGKHNPYWGSDVKCKKSGKKLSKDNVKHVNVYPSK